MKTQYKHLGLDIGRVIMAPVTGGKSDTSFLSGNLEQAMQTPPASGAIDSVATLVEAFAGNVWLVSKAGFNTQSKTLQWFVHNDFYRKTGLNPAYVRFCRKRHEKAMHCQELGISYFVDDRLDVLEYLKGCVKKRYLFGEQPVGQWLPNDITPVLNWPQTVEQILRDIQNVK